MNTSIQTGQVSENDPAKTVIVCAPALSKMMGSLHPAGALYEKPVNTKSARKAHDNFIERMRSNGCEVLEVHKILTDRVNWSVGDRISLENLACKCLTYRFEHEDIAAESAVDEGGDRERTISSNFDEAEKYYVSDKYKRSVIEQMDVQQLADIIFTNPTVTISPSQRDTGYEAKYTFHPLSNIVFVRDQQITTSRGIVMANLTASQRAREVDIMEFCLRKVGLNVIDRIPAPGHLEGGDFFPVDESLCFLGIGPRSNWAAAEYLLRNDLFGTKKVAIVKDEYEKCQDRMHLDTVFNIIGPRCCIMLEEMMGEASPTHRVVDEYELVSMANGDNHPKEDEGEMVGSYRLSKKKCEFTKYLGELGFAIIPVSGKEQLNYGCNALNLGNGHLISIEKNVARRIARSPHYTGTVEFLDFQGITCMYGGVHCATQVVYRECRQGGDEQTPTGSEELGMGNGRSE